MWSRTAWVVRNACSVLSCVAWSGVVRQRNHACALYPPLYGSMYGLVAVLCGGTGPDGTISSARCRERWEWGLGRSIEEIKGDL